MNKCAHTHNYRILAKMLSSVFYHFCCLIVHTKKSFPLRGEDIDVHLMFIHKLDAFKYIALYGPLRALKNAHVAQAVIEFDTADLYYCNMQQ